MKEIVVATRNKGKLREFSDLLSTFAERIIPIDEISPGIEIEESGATFRENALLKAREVFRTTHLPTLADDSGLEVESLGGLPGVLSARFAGHGATDSENIERLLRELEGVKDRRARFVCCLAFICPDGGEVTIEGYCGGIIAEKPIGEGGFGYDPVFYLPDMKRTMAQLSTSEKNRISHRAKASRALLMYLAGQRCSP
jgi:XTP/dITP diphosphohydrolase